MKAGVLAIAVALVSAAPASAEPLESFFPILTRRPVIEYEVELRTTHDKQREARDTTTSLAIETPLLPRWGVSLSVPIVFSDPATAPFAAGIGDVELETKLVVYASGDRRALVTAGLSLTLPTGSEDRRLGGALLVEPFATLGFVVNDLLIISDVGYIASLEGSLRDRRRIHGGVAIGHPVGRHVIPFLTLTAAGTLDGPTAHQDQRRRGLEVYLGPGINVWISPRATLGLGVQVPLTRARVLDYALFTTIDWDL